jgi:hypothetical protein
MHVYRKHRHRSIMGELLFRHALQERAYAVRLARAENAEEAAQDRADAEHDARVRCEETIIQLKSLISRLSRPE